MARNDCGILQHEKGEVDGRAAEKHTQKMSDTGDAIKLKFKIHHYDFSLPPTTRFD